MSWRTTLTANVLAGDTTISVADTDSPTYAFPIVIGSEQMQVIGGYGTTTLTVIRDVSADTDPATVFIDDFSRTEPDSFGLAADGSDWTGETGASRTYSVNGSAAIIVDSAGGTTPPSNHPQVYAPQDGELRFRFKLDKRPGSLTCQIEARLRQQRAPAAVDRYRYNCSVQTNGDVNLRLSKTISGVLTNFGSNVTKGAGFIVVDTWYWIAIQATGASPTSLSGKVWKESDGEPGSWDNTASDSAATLQGNGLAASRFEVDATDTNLPITFTMDDWTIRNVAVGVTHTSGEVVEEVDLITWPYSPVVVVGKGVPVATPQDGSLYLDQLTGKLYVRNGTSWVPQS